MVFLLNVSFISVLRGGLGILVLLGIAWLFSSNRKAIDWPLVAKGLALQLILALLILKTKYVSFIFDFIGKGFLKITSFTQYGVDFLFTPFGAEVVDNALINFAFNVLPVIVFFSALTSMLYYWGILQKVVFVFAWIMKHTMKLSGAESLAAAGNVFLGQTEAPLLVKPYLATMTRSEMMSLMTGGMATIAGSVLAAYVTFLGGADEAERLLFTTHLLAASIMSAPAAIVAAKILVPEKEKFNDSMSISKEKMGTNVLEAIATGTTDGLKLAVNVGAMLLVFTAFIYMGNYILEDIIGANLGLNEIIQANTEYSGLTFQFLMGYAFAPIAWLLGVASDDIVYVGQLLGEKTILNEFFAYDTLGKMKKAHVFAEEKSAIMATYMLCGFANFASIGIQIGGIGSLAPTRKGLLSQLGVKALIGGTLASLFTAATVGMLI